MKTPLPVTCIILKSACQAVCRPFSDQFRRRSTLRSGSLRSALTALLLAPLAALLAADGGQMQPTRRWDFNITGNLQGWKASSN